MSKQVEVADDFGQGEEVVALEAQSEDLRTMAEALRVRVISSGSGPVRSSSESGC